jgi:hypothetical protein
MIANFCTKWFKQNQKGFKLREEYFLQLGHVFTITWTPDDGDAVALALGQGGADKVQIVQTITDNAPNTGV